MGNNSPRLDELLPRASIKAPVAGYNVGEPMNEYALGISMVGLAALIGFLCFRMYRMQGELEEIIQELPFHRRTLKPLPTKPISGLAATKVMHPWDTNATKGLKAIPFLDSALKKLHKLGYEEYLRTENIANCLLVGPSIYPRVYKTAETVRAVLGLPPIEVWITLSPDANAYTDGINKPWIVLNSGIVDMVDEHELAFILGHEMGHILCEHVLYSSLAYHFLQLTDVASEMTLGLGGAASAAVQPALMEWARQAELSADRVGLLAVRDLNVALRVMIMLAGGGMNGKKECDPKAILQQAALYNQMKGVPGWLFRVTSAYRTSHPWPIVRAEHLAKWHSSSEFATLTS